MTRHDELIAISERLKWVLLKAAIERTERDYDVQVHPGDAIPAWVLYERYQMLCAVNLELARHRYAEPVRIEAIERAEQLAVGHSDYAEKFALLCAEIVLGERT